MAIKRNGCFFSSIVILLVFLVQGCTQSVYLLNDKFLNDAFPVNAEDLDRNIQFAELKNVPFFSQTKYQCGPAAIATVANYYHLNKSPEDISREIYLPEKKGSLQVEVIAEIRSLGLVPYPLSPSLENIFSEIESGFPVLVLQNLGLKAYPVWHYAVVVGFDIENKVLLLNSGKHERLEIPVSYFYNTWLKAAQWAIAVVPVDKLPSTANLKVFMSTIADLEELGNLEGAYKAYSLAQKEWPDSILPLAGLGNIAYKSGEYKKSRKHFLKALKIAPNDADILNNLAYAYGREQCFTQADEIINKAIRLQPDNKTYLSSKQEIKFWDKDGHNTRCPDN